ncbi:MAG: putative glycoside hydrolase [Myxococcaceae bacterium]
MNSSPLAAAVALFSLVLTACVGTADDPNAGAGPQPADSEIALTVGTNSLSMTAGESITLHAAVTTMHAASLYVLKFESSAPAVATVDGDGLVRAVANGTSTIKLTATVLDTNATATAQVTVNVSPAGPTQKPAMPTSLALSTTTTSVKLTWHANASTDAVDRYQVYRDDTLLADGPTALTYTDSAVTAGSTHTYRVSAHNAIGYGPWTAALTAHLGGGATAYNPPFPRLGAYPIGSPQKYDAAFRAVAAKYHVVIVSNWAGYSTTDAPNMAAVFADIKARSTVGTKLFNYIISSETEPYYEASLLSKVTNEKWYLYKTGSNGTPVASDYPGATEVNNTLFAKKDANGLRYTEWYTNLRYAQFVTGDSQDVPNPNGDGFFMDNVFWSPRVDGDWNLDGVTDLHTDTTVQGWYRDGYKHYFDYVRTLWPNSLQIGNVADWGQPQAVLGVYDQLLNGGVLEGMIGHSWSIETYGGFTAMMAHYRKTMDALAAPKLGIFGDDQPATDYQAMRYGLCSTLMDDGYYFHSNGGSYAPPPPWYDEFDFNLGYPVTTAQGARQTTAWKQGVWRRDFDHGIVLVNPKGNGPQTITLGGTFKKLHGTQAPSVNNGATVTTVTLGERDGIILSR